MVGVNATVKLACVLLLLVFVGSVTATKDAYAAIPLALDGLGTHSTCSVFVNQSPNCDAQLLTTTHGHDIIVLEIVDSACCNTNTTISSIIDSSGLTFTLHINYTTTAAKIWEYYTRATSPLNSDNITVVYADSDFGWIGIQVIAIHGANTQAIFDRNPSIPATCTFSNCGNCGVNFASCVTIQTSALDFVIASVAINDAPGCGGETGQGGLMPPGFIDVLSTGKMDVWYSVTTTPRTSVVFNCEATDVNAIVVDAVSFHGAFGT
jgi:hypothetical protein